MHSHGTFVYVVLVSVWSRLSCLVSAKMEASGSVSDLSFSFIQKVNKIYYCIWHALIMVVRDYQNIFV